MITNDYFAGYFAALRTIEDNVNHRLEALSEPIMTIPDGISELNAINEHIRQVRHSYQMMINELNSLKPPKQLEKKND